MSTIFKSILIISAVFFSTTSFAQVFFSTYGGVYDDCAYYIQQDTMGNFILCGDSGRTTASTYNSQGILMKYDPQGNILLVRTYGDSVGERFRTVKPTLDGGYLLHGDQDGFWVTGCVSLLMKTNFSGDSLWSLTDFGAMDTRNGFGIIPLQDTTYIISTREDNAQFYNPYQLQRIDRNGIDVWNSRTDVIFNGTGLLSGAGMIHTFENQVAVTGTNFIGGTGDYEIIVSKVDTNGGIVWSKQYGSAGVDWMSASICQNSDSGFIVSGITNNQSIGGYDMLLLRLDKNGDSIWTKKYGGSGLDYFSAAEQVIDGGFVAFGYSNSAAGNYDAIIMRLDANGDSLWQQAYGGMNDEIVKHGIVCHDHGFAITGSTQSYGAGGEDIFILRSDSSGNPITNKNEFLNSGFYIFPNPFKDGFRLQTTQPIKKIIISDLFGRVLKEDHTGRNEMTRSLSLSPGIYLCIVEYLTGDYDIEKIVCSGQ